MQVAAALVRQSTVSDAQTTSAVCNRAISHSRSEIYEKYYTKKKVAADTQSAFLGTPSKDWMISMASHLSLTRDPNASNLVSKPSKEEVDSHAEVFPLMQQVDALRSEICLAHGSLRAAHGTPESSEHKENKRDLQAARLRIRKELERRN